MKYRPEIDGLRAVAVLPVILFHAGFASFSGGFVGVDVFFVISGYLITSIIVKDFEAGRFSAWDFYERRARRILPALFLVMLCCIPFAWMWMTAGELKAFSNTLVSVILFVSNIRLWQQSGYFDTSAELKPLLHTWSLAVEEQYYIIFPIAIMWLWRLGRRNIIGSIALVAILSLALSEYASRYYPAFSFYWLPTRAWELMAGALCSFVFLKPSLLRDNVLSVAGFAAIGVSVFAYDATVPFPSLYALLPVLGTCAVLLFAGQHTLIGCLLSLKPIVGIGLVSYSAYLWHQPLFAFARIRSLHEPAWQLMLLLAASSLILAYLTWRFVETPARRRGAWPLPDRRTVFAFFGVAGAAFIAAGVVGHFASGFPLRVPDEAATLARYSDDRNPRNGCIDLPAEPVSPGQSCVYGTAQAVQFALLGDSHANALAFELGKQLSAQSAGFREFSQAGCPPVYSYIAMSDEGRRDCGDYHTEVMKFLSQEPQIRTILLWARWTLYVEFDRFDNREGGVEELGRVVPAGSDQIEIGKLYQKTISELLSLGYRVVVIYPQPEVGWNVPRHLSKATQLGIDIERPLSTSYDLFKKRSQRAYAALDALGENEKLLRILPEQIFCNTLVKNRCAVEDGKVPFYSDDDHVNSVGASLIAREIIKAMQEKGWIANNAVPRL